ncbi:thioesterase II family protein [Streptomyces purpureus]|uniref:Thioesterase domain-containing protein n=1 Tax=Streptomyces purpureus TaxID=1951 RepID=A0A918LLQ6_9ACTN|nr:thioesterase domain-containing protein [Streptomyces purpureus]GGT14302.1 hypothetical protein GCM10014713_03690 [Streptomyces purpureus]
MTEASTAPVEDPTVRVPGAGSSPTAVVRTAVSGPITRPAPVEDPTVPVPGAGSPPAAVVRTAVSGPIARPAPVEDPAVRLFMFHHAGGSHLLYRGWAKHFPDDWEICLLDAPGRGRLQALPLIEDCGELVAYFHQALAPWLDRPFAFFGNSMGGLVAYELTCRLVRDGGPVPRWLGVSAYGGPPAEAGADGSRHLLSDGALRDWLRDAGGSPPKLLDNDAVWGKFGPVFRGDFSVVDTWASPRDPLSVPVPVSVFGGRGDTLVGVDRLMSWSAYTDDFLGLRMYDGDHFYLTDHRESIARAITDALSWTAL